MIGSLRNGVPQHRLSQFSVSLSTQRQEFSRAWGLSNGERNGIIIMPADFKVVLMYQVDLITTT
jgi:hypothetical protein